MEYLHSKDIVYKDLKASHVFIDNTLRVTLIDLGLSEQCEPDGICTRAEGTFHAMSPEMLALYKA